MTLRPLRSKTPQSRENALDYEIVQEQAAALGRLGRALEAALAALSTHDRQQAEGCRGDIAPSIRQSLVQDASTALCALSFSARRAGCATSG